MLVPVTNSLLNGDFVIRLISNPLVLMIYKGSSKFSMDIEAVIFAVLFQRARLLRSLIIMFVLRIALTSQGLSWVMVRLGFNNSGADIISSRIKSNSPNGLFGINIGPNKDTKNRLEDYLICLRKFHALGDYLTINISSPNTENLRSLHNQNELDELLNAIQEEKQALKSKILIAVKISPDIEEFNITKIADLLIKYNTAAVIISNTTDGNRENLININKLEKGGLSGKPLEKKSNILINRFYKYCNFIIMIIHSTVIIIQIFITIQITNIITRFVIS